MSGAASRVPYTCARCLRAASREQQCLPRFDTRLEGRRSFRQLHSPLRQSSSSEAVARKEPDAREEVKGNDAKAEEKSENEIHNGAMSQRLEQATEDALLEGGRAGRQAIESAGFSEELKERLLEKVAAAKFQSENAAAIAEAGLSPSTGKGTRDIATAQPWTGTESTEDAVLRMLTDAYKPLKPGNRGRGGTSSSSPGAVVDLRLKPQGKVSPGQRLVNARDKSSIYAISRDTQLSEKERDAMRREMKARFQPGAKAMPSTLQGLASLANERIEDAIARGQFKNIPRGKAIERDPRADNPFIDTTEYFMNKMIQRQDIVPPWIEKQQELVKAANSFRVRLRADWRRHAARTISSRGGSLQDQLSRADRYAQSEALHNPKRRSVEEIAAAPSGTDHPVMVKITREVPASPDSQVEGEEVIQVKIEGEDAELTITDPEAVVPDLAASAQDPPASTTTSSTNPQPPPSTPGEPLPPPFRDPTWLLTETPYLTLSISNLNSLTRSYNLMAPDLAKKPYYSLDRELLSCYADVAPQIRHEILERAQKPARDLVEKIGHRPGSVMERFAVGETVRVWDERRPSYGFRELWRDLWRREEKERR